MASVTSVNNSKVYQRRIYDLKTVIQKRPQRSFLTDRPRNDKCNGYVSL